MLAKKMIADGSLGMASVLAFLTLAGCSVQGTDVHMTRATEPTLAATPAAKASADNNAETKDQVCRTLIDSYNSSTAKFVARPQTFKVERQYQRVIRKACDGQVVSDKIETVRPPHVRLHLLLPKSREFKSVFLFNETTCDHVQSGAPKESSLAGTVLNSILPLSSLMSPIQGDGKSYIDVNGDLATGLLTFEVAKGPNVIFAEYHYDCMPKIKGNVRAVRQYDEAHSCETSVDKHIVIYPIVTTYEEKTLPGAQVVEADKASCERR